MEYDSARGLWLPNFWEPPADLDLDADVHKLGGHPSILIAISSYRDFQCPETVLSALTRAVHPERLVFAIVQQNSPEDVHCGFPPKPSKPCSEEPDNLMCVHEKNIKVFTMDHTKGVGPTYARHVGHRMYRGEAFVLQIDSHVQFVQGWDVDMIQQWRNAKNEYAVLSTYLTDTQGSLDEQGRSLRKTRPIMCNSGFEGANKNLRYLRHGSQPEEVPRLKNEPMLQPFWAAGLSFSRGHFVVRVPYDCCLPMIFQGEEISIGLRGWTHGYDYYAPQRSVLFHEYAVFSKRRKKIKMFWENTNSGLQKEADSALRRLLLLSGLAPDALRSAAADPSAPEHALLQQSSKYGLGSQRPVDLFFRLFLVDIEKHTSVNVCPFVQSGKLHRLLKEHLRSDGLGINVSAVADFDTAAALGLTRSSRASTLDLSKVNPSFMRGKTRPAPSDAKNCARENQNDADAKMLAHVEIEPPSAAAAPTLLCIVITADQRSQEAEAVAHTWGQRCDGIVFFSDIGAPAGEVPKVDAGEETAEVSWSLKLSIWLSIAATPKLAAFDYYLWAQDSTYVAVDNLKAFLRSSAVAEPHARSEPLFIGRRFRREGSTDAEAVFLSNSGYLLNQAALRELVAKARGSGAACRLELEAPGDLQLAACMRGSGEPSKGGGVVVPIETRTTNGAERFIPLSPGVSLSYDPVSGGESSPPWYRRYSIELRLGQDCCAAKAITFGSVSAAGLYRIEDALYGCRAKGGAVAAGGSA